MKQTLFWILVLLFLYSCENSSSNSKSISPSLVVFSTNSDSTLHYYNMGWHQIMDLGDYSAAEISYREALEFDEDFLVGKSVLARLTTDHNERMQLYDELENKKSIIKGDERLILDVYIALTKYTNLRDQKSDDTEKALDDAFQMGFKNFGQIAHKYPDEIYLKSEYIEVVHSLHGAQAALDTLINLTDDTQKLNPFVLGYRAIMTAETGDYDEALQFALRLSTLLEGQEVARPDAILADIYFKMENYTEAKIHADKAHDIDPRNLDASRLKEKIDAKLE